jgi:hypothetical protein
MMRNFSRMPRLLKLLTLGAFLSLAFALSKPFTGVGVFGEPITFLKWFGSAAGLAFVLPALVLGTSAILILRKSQYGRVVHVAGWCAMIVGAYTAAQLEQLRPPMLVPGLAFDAAIAAFIALYLLLNKQVEQYLLDPK